MSCAAGNSAKSVLHRLETLYHKDRHKFMAAIKEAAVFLIKKCKTTKRSKQTVIYFNFFVNLFAPKRQIVGKFLSFEMLI